MALFASTPQPVTRSANCLARAVVFGGVGLGVALMITALVLWFHYGTAVFFEMIASGFAACF
jgi:hypothetical protein